MIRGEEASYCAGAEALLDREGGQRDGRSRVTWSGFDEEVVVWKVRELLLYKARVCCRGCHHHALGPAGQRKNAVVCGLEEGAAALAEVEELLWVRCGGEGLEALALATGHDDGNELHVGHDSPLRRHLGMPTLLTEAPFACLERSKGA